MLPEPVIDGELSLLGRRGRPRIKGFWTQRTFEALVLCDLPGLAGIESQRLDADSPKPATHRIGREIGPVIGFDVLGGTEARQERLECFNNIVGTQPSAHRHRRHSPRDLIQKDQHLAGLSVAELVQFKLRDDHIQPRVFFLWVAKP